MKTGIITTDSYSSHETGQGHPERADRVSVVIENLKKNKKLAWKKPGKFDSKYLKITHNSNYINEVEKSFPKKGLFFLDGDTIVSPGSKKAASDAVGSIITAIDGVQNKEFKNVFCAVRPPGHHAEKDKAMGFCIYNNVAVGAYYLIEKYKLNRIAIIDFDVHHGNGTQNILWNDPDCLFISIHQSKLFPFTGLENETGKRDNILNIPVNANSNSFEFRNIVDKIVIPKLKEFKPNFLLISAGFDGEKDDQMSQTQWVESDFIYLTKKLKSLAKKYCDNRIVSCLEGGYHLEKLASCCVSHIKTLME